MEIDLAQAPEFEFWPELDPGPNLLTADELFADGVLLPLHLLSLAPVQAAAKSSDVEPKVEAKAEDDLQVAVAVVVSEEAAPAAGHPEASICLSACSTPSSSKRWKDIFKVGGKKEAEVAAGAAEQQQPAREKEKKKERKPSGGGPAELNINIWPFSRSRSAGTGRPKPAAAAAAAAMRKSSSAPCSRSNSRGEGSGGRRWAASPGRPGVGVHVGRASPVWQVKRAGSGPGRTGLKEKGKKGPSVSGPRGLGLSVNSCIGYRSQGSCRAEEADGGVPGGAGGGLFKIRALFSKKVY